MLAPGSVVDGRYRVDREVGEGGYATVFRARHLALDVPVALKVLRLPPELTDAQRAEGLAQFVEEARIIARIRHPNVVRTLDQGFAVLEGGATAPYLVMEWCELGSLRDSLRARGPSPWSLGEAWPLLGPIAAALAAVHEIGVAHRDLKPGNVMMTGGGGAPVCPRVIDFGIAKLCDPDERAGSGATKTRSRSSAYTRAYAAPEQLAGARTGPWTDVHAFALLFVEVVAGRAPYGEPEVETVALAAERPTPRRFGIDVGAFEEVLERALALRPLDRFADGASLFAALEGAASRMGLASAASVAHVSLAPIEPLASDSFENPKDPTTRTDKTVRTDAGPPTDTGATMTLRTTVRSAPAVPLARSIEPPRPSRRAILAGGATLGAVAVGLAVARTREGAPTRANPVSEASGGAASAARSPNGAGGPGAISLVSPSGRAVVERLAALGVSDAALAGPETKAALRVDFQRDGVAGCVQWNDFSTFDAVVWRPVAASTARWLYSTGLCARYVAARAGGLFLGWRDGPEGARLFSGLIEGVAHDELRDPAGDASWSVLPPPQPIASMVALTADELRTRMVAAGASIQGEALGCPLRIQARIEGEPGEIWWFSPMFESRLGPSDRFRARRDAIVASGARVAHAEQTGAGVIATGAFADAARLGKLLEGATATVAVAGPR